MVSIASAQTVDNNPLSKQEVMEQIAEVLSKEAFVPGLDFTKWPEMVKKEQKQIDEAKNDDEFQRAINAALRKFGATHIVLNSPRIADLRSNGSTVGVGISSQRTPDGLLITRTISDAPAERAGIVAGDVVTAVDGNQVAGAAAIAGREGSDVTLTIRHADGKSEDYILTRRRYSTLRPEELTWVDKDTVKIAIYTFDYAYDRERISRFMKEASSAKNLILDLRDNGGGLISNFRSLLGYFVEPTKPLGTFIDRKMVEDFVTATKGSVTDLPSIARWSPRKLRSIPDESISIFKGHVVVLVNGISGSASEIIAEGLRDTIGATIVGTKSAGAVLVSKYVPVTNGFMLQYPLSDYVSIRGIRLEGVGVLPDVTVSGPKLLPPSVPDPVVKKAVEIFSAATGSNGHDYGEKRS